MATTPILEGEFIKVIDNDGNIRIPRTIAEAVQLPDGSSLQDYINAVNDDREVIDYIILHEYCHLKYKSHCKSFIKMLEKYEPNYKKYERIVANI